MSLRNIFFAFFMKNLFNKRKSILFLCTFIFSSFFVFAIQVPELTSPVIDNAQLLSSEQKNTLSKKLYSISEQTKSQIVVVTIPSLEGVDIETYTMTLAEKWKIGSKEKDDGVILCVAYDERKIRIEVGYGLEGLLTDAKSGMIIRKIIAPKFQQGEYGQGIIDAVDVISGIIGVDGVVVDNSIFEKEKIKADKTSFPIVLVFFIIYGIFISGALSSKFPWLRWLPWYFLFANRSDNHRSHDDDFFGGFGNSSHGGGFGGFSGGGGGFGGGGASGGW